MYFICINKWHLSQPSSSIFIMSCRLHGYPWPSLATSLYRSSPPAGLQGYVPYPHIAAVCMFELVVLLLLGHMWGSIGVHQLWARPCFSSCVLHAWFVYFKKPGFFYRVFFVILPLEALLDQHFILLDTWCSGYSKW